MPPDLPYLPVRDAIDSSHTTMGDLITFAIALLTITNPIGAMAIYAGMAADLPAVQKRETPRKAAIAIAVILIVITWSGEGIMAFFGISIPAFETAGGIIIASMGLSMLHGKPSAVHHSAEEESAEVPENSIAVVPIAMPMIAGPGAITTVVVATHKNPMLAGKLSISLVCVGIALLLWLALKFATPISEKLGPEAVGVVSRVMGIVLTAIAVGMMASGLKDLFPGLA